MPGTMQRMNVVHPHKYKLGNSYVTFLSKQGIELVIFYKITSFNNDIVLHT